MATAGELIKGSLRLLGVLAEGEEPSADSYADALVAFNQMLDSWSAERLSVYGLKEAVYTWPAGETSQTIGPNGDFGETPCPLRIDDSTYYVVNDISYPLTLINEDQYNAITLKGSTTTLPTVMWQNTILITDTNIEMKMHPVPSQDLEMHLVWVQPLTQAGATSDTLYFPQGYLRAMRYNLALELAPEFGVVPSVDVRNIARNSKRDLKRINNPGDLMSMPTAILPRVPRFNIYSGY